MIVNKILGNLKDYDTKHKTIAWVNIHPGDRLKKIVRLKADNGNEFGINLDDDVILKDGDVLGEDDENIFVLKCFPQNVIVIKPDTLTQMGFVAHSIGNNHTPAIFENDTMIVEYDYIIEKMLNEMKVSFERKDLVLDTPLKHASHHH
ncbi:MAG: urease accessory protein UreE [Campylobacter sputorum]|uniref:Urease accessory protein UreE n=1 Tax=Campylobacter sputorum biovar paraureolyticus TaxID=593874 RepID=C9K309_9BACT|nr:urease accessory protein UreE [Campylobacter sputorum]ASM38053.1 urease accessory protein UreE [Campylobacter sputorum bv. paraureolyticus LMG 11764]MDY6121196.1 urease accessory protein UreE [Campylobacter sputorum]BAI43676.1 urease accessory protein E [Campylobacter sputorum biovar paraureolyticus]